VPVLVARQCAELAAPAVTHGAEEQKGMARSSGHPRRTEHLSVSKSSGSAVPSWMRTALYAILFALLFWLVFSTAVGMFILAGGAGDSNPFGDASGLFLLLPIVAGGIYGWRRGHGKS
jgi:hypothetical protein